MIGFYCCFLCRDKVNRYLQGALIDLPFNQALAGRFSVKGYTGAGQVRQEKRTFALFILTGIRQQRYLENNPVFLFFFHGNFGPDAFGQSAGAGWRT
ncbi:MAG: hypothetical protein ACQERN_09935 [Thermodesulfobacteriota bacterium]